MIIKTTQTLTAELLGQIIGASIREALAPMQKRIDELQARIDDLDRTKQTPRLVAVPRG